MGADMFPGPQDLWRLLELHNNNRIDYNNRKWETIKFFQAVYAALLGASLAAVVAARRDTLTQWTVTGLLLVAAAGAFIAMKNLKRETILLFLEEFQVFKLARVLGLDMEIPNDQRWFPPDGFLLIDKWRNWHHGVSNSKDPNKYGTLEQLAKRRSKGHYFEDLFAILFYLEAIIALGLVFLIWQSTLRMILGW